MQTAVDHSFQGTCCKLETALWVQVSNLCGILTHCPTVGARGAVELTLKSNRSWMSCSQLRLSLH
jgi:hypothetical protein